MKSVCPGMLMASWPGLSYVPLYRWPLLSYRVRLPRSALLNKYADIDGSGKYVQLVRGVANIDMIGQRLYTGRIVIAGEVKGCWGGSMEEACPRDGRGGACERGYESHLPSAPNHCSSPPAKP